MLIARVKGNVVSTRKHPALVGSKLMIVESQTEPKQVFVAVDSVGAGIGDQVLVTCGSNARFGHNNPASPVDATIIGIIDEN